MAKNVEHVSHKKSNVKIDGKPKLPLASAMVEGEIAINYAEGVETISIRNENSAITTFSSDEYYTKKKLGSGFTNNDVTITEVIDDINNRKLDASAYTPIDLSNYYTKDETSGKTELSTALGTKVNSATYTGHTADTTLHFSDNEKRNLGALATNIETISGITSNDVTNWNNAASIDINNYYTKENIDDKLGSGFSISSITEVIEENEKVTSESLNDLNVNKLDISAFTTYSGVVNTIINSKASENDLTTLSGDMITHTTNTTIHLTSAEKDQLHAHDNKTYLDSISGFVDTMAYESVDSYSSATQVNSALDDKVDNVYYSAFSAATNSSIDDLSGQSETISAALNDLNERLIELIGRVKALEDAQI